MLLFSSQNNTNETPSEERDFARNDLNIQYQLLASIIDNEIVEPILVIGLITGLNMPTRQPVLFPETMNVPKPGNPCAIS